MKKFFSKHFYKLFLFLLCILFTLNFVIGLYLIPFSSMQPSLLAGDRVLVSHLSYGIRSLFSGKLLFLWSSPKRGDLVLLYAPTKPEQLTIKRVIGLPNDEVLFRNGRVFINGNEMKLNYEDNDYYADNARVKVPEEKFYVLSDSSESLFDSRTFGFVDKDALLGQVKGVLFSTTGSGFANFRAQRWFHFVM